MNIVKIQGFENHDPGEVILDLNEQKVKHCLGCWNCWLKTPGRCAQTDLDVFYHAFLNADEAVFYFDIKHDFINSNMKNVIDRLIVLALPYISFKSGESRHHHRYEKLPKITMLYQPNFSSKDAEKAFLAYLSIVTRQFYAEDAVIKRYQEVVS